MGAAVRHPDTPTTLRCIRFCAPMNFEEVLTAILSVHRYFTNHYYNTNWVGWKLITYAYVGYGIHICSVICYVR